MNNIQGAAAPEFERVVEAFAATTGETGGSAHSIRI
jgi:hypothetical protein